MKPFEEGLLAFVKDKYPDVIEGLRTKQAMDKDLEASLLKASGEFKAKFVAGA